jgi:tRNA(adenine34) deaminase
MPDRDEHYMRLALEAARRACENKEVPVGAVVVCGDQVVGLAGNEKETRRDPTAHAEIVALRQAAHRLDRWRLSDCQVYVTLEPCPMCVGAMLAARVQRLVFGCTDLKAGAVVSLFSLASDSRLNHRIDALGGVLAEECSSLLRAFFQSRRE